MTTTELITLPIAVVGAVLGIVNTWRGLDRDRLKLRVIPKIALPAGGLDRRQRLCIEVINLSTFPVTINEVGFHLKGTTSRWALVSPTLLDGGKFPRRLEPRSAFTAYFDPGPESDPGFPLIAKAAYASTDCQETKTGSVKNILRMLRHQLRDAEQLTRNREGR